MKIINKIAIVFLLIGLGMLCGGGYWAIQTKGFLEKAVLGEGIVVELVQSQSSDSTTYAPIVHFTTEDGRKIEFVSSCSSNPPAYSIGQKVSVRYDRTHPEKAKIDGFFSLWGGPLILLILGMGFSLFGVGFFAFQRIQAQRIAHLRQYGIPIQTKFISVEQGTTAINNRYSIRIVSQWQNPNTNEIHLFKSEDLWFDPTEYIPEKGMTVYIELNNPRKYYMDISFLPKMTE